MHGGHAAGQGSAGLGLHFRKKLCSLPRDLRAGWRGCRNVGVRQPPPRLAISDSCSFQSEESHHEFPHQNRHHHSVHLLHHVSHIPARLPGTGRGKPGRVAAQPHWLLRVNPVQPRLDRVCDRLRDADPPKALHRAAVKRTSSQSRRGGSPCLAAMRRACAMNDAISQKSWRRSAKVPINSCIFLKKFVYCARQKMIVEQIGD